MSLESPVVSICSPIMNQIGMAREMIQSVVEQTFKDWELIIVDDCSTEDLQGMIDTFNDSRIRYYRNEVNKGPLVSQNFAIREARGKYIGLLCADEFYEKDKLKEQVAYLEANTAVDCVWGLPGSGTTPPAPGQVWPLGPRPEWEQYQLGAHNRSRESWLRTLLNLEGVPIGGCGLLMKKSVMDDLGGMDESLTIFADHELYCRFFEKYKGVILPFRWASDKPATKDSVRFKNIDNAMKELEYVRSKHPLIIPPTEGKITVGIPCYNQARFLPDLIASIKAQTRPVDEILILNDCSTDDFKTIAQGLDDPRIKLMAFDENRGVQEAMNQMAFRAEGEFFLPISADDVIEPTTVEKLLGEFKKNPWIEYAGCQTDFVDETLKNPAPADHPFWQIARPTNKSREEWLAHLHGGNQYFGVGMYRTKVISDVGGWEKQYKVISDYQMYLKLLQRENIAIVEENLTHTRVHKDQASFITDHKKQRELPWLYHAARKRFYRQHMKVVIATPFYELKGFSPYITSMMQTARMLQAVGIDYRFMELSGDSYVHRARNTMCDMFLMDPDATDLFFVDSDMSWNPEAFVNMCMLPDDVVGGAYPVKNNWEAWTSIPKLHIKDGMQELHGRTLQDGSALIEAQVLAGGFLRIKRNVLERFREYYKDLWYEEPTTFVDEPSHRFTSFFGAESIDHKFFGEDHCFAKRLREMGIKMFIYPNINIVHWGYKAFDGNYDVFLKRQKIITEQAVMRDNKTPGPMHNQPGVRLVAAG